MPDETSPTPTPSVSPELQALADAIGHDIQDVRIAIAAYKSGGKAALFASLPNMVGDVQKTFTDIKAELPKIKSGWRTSEFWMGITFSVGNVAYLGITGKPIPTEVNLAISGVIAVYTFVRVLLKKSTPTA